MASPGLGVCPAARGAVVALQQLLQHVRRGAAVERMTRTHRLLHSCQSNGSRILGPQKQDRCGIKRCGHRKPNCGVCLGCPKLGLSLPTPFRQHRALGKAWRPHTRPTMRATSSAYHRLRRAAGTRPDHRRSPPTPRDTSVRPPLTPGSERPQISQCHASTWWGGAQHPRPTDCEFYAAHARLVGAVRCTAQILCTTTYLAVVDTFSTATHRCGSPRSPG
jgi:hypothetical protein